MTENVNAGVVSNEAVAPINTTSNDNTFDFSKYVTDDLKADPDFDRISQQFPKEGDKFVKEYFHQKKHFGKVRETVRAELEAEMKKPVVYNADQYSYELPENYTIEDEILNTAKTKAAELGISPEAAKSFMSEIFKADSQIEAKLAAETKAAEEKAIANLKSEWGNDYEKRLEKANNTWSRFTSPEDDTLIEKLPMNAKVLLSRVMDKIGQKVSEASIGKIDTAPKTMTKEIFESKAREIRSSKMSHSEQTAQLNELYGKYYKPEDMNKYYTKSTSSTIL